MVIIFSFNRNAIEHVFYKFTLGTVNYSLYGFRESSPGNTVAQN